MVLLKTIDSFFLFQEYYGEIVLHIAIIKQNAAMVEWLLSDEYNRPYREEQLIATATGDFFKVSVQTLFRTRLDSLFLF